MGPVGLHARLFCTNLLIAGCAVSKSLAQHDKGLLARQTQTIADDPPTDKFLRRLLHSSNPSIEVQYTLSIDMSKSWNNKSVLMYLITKGDTPAFNLPSLWPSNDGQGFYSFGGDVSPCSDRKINIPEVAVYQFLAGINGDGTWITNKSNDNTGFRTLTRPARMQSGRVQDTALFFGGYENARTSPGSANLGRELVYVPGIVSYNGTTGIWNNDTSLIAWDNTNSGWGFSMTVRLFGPRGLLIMTGVEYDAENGPQKMNNITIYDPISKSWKWQPATGTIPDGSLDGCSVGIQGDNGTFEIFIYGGQTRRIGKTAEQDTSNIALDRVAVLSLPGFVWFQADYQAAHPRIHHSCNVVGNRQMLSIGGVDSRGFGRQSAPDYLPKGLAIFDLTEMKWKDSYNAGAPPYKSPQVVKTWYDKNSIEAIRWHFPEVKSYFKKDESDPARPNNNPAQASPTSNTPSSSTLSPPSSTTSSTPPSSTSSTPPSSTSSTPPSSTSYTNKGAVTGGAVGGIAGLLILSIMAWILVRKRRQGGPGEARQGDENEQARTEEEMARCPQDGAYSSIGYPSEVETGLDRAELSNGREAAEKYSLSRVEMNGNRHWPVFEVEGRMIGH
ncbi:MAG: hypothetical protein Q9217_004874 [Psora testacea]